MHLKKSIVSFLKLLVSIYQNGISPFFPARCRFQPTCSSYMMQALEIHGIRKGLYLGIRRILRCHPWGSKGYDPVPKNTKKCCEIC